MRTLRSRISQHLGMACDRLWLRVLDSRDTPVACPRLATEGHHGALRNGPGLSLRARISGALLLVFATLALTTAPALASRGHVFSGTFGSTGSGPGQLSEPSGVAANEATGDVYVVDKGNNRVERFTAEGVFQSEFTGPNATGTGTLTENSTTIENAVAETGAFSVGEEISAVGLPPFTTITAVNPGGVLEVSQPATASESATLSAHQSFERPEGIAIDNSCALRELAELKCNEEDPSNGDVYVVDSGHRVIDKFTPDGEYITQLTEAGGSFFQGEGLDGVAVDPEGTVWVYREAPVVDGFKFTTALESEFLGETHLGSGFGLPGFAVDAEGAFYVRHPAGEDFIGRMAKVDSSGNVLIQELDPEKSTAVAVDQTNNDSFIDNLTTVGVFDPTGALLERLGSGHLTEGSGIGVNAGSGSSAGSGSLYVADAAADLVVVFGPTEPSPPTVESESVAEITSESASLGAEIDPRSESGEHDTEYHFEYGPCASPSTCEASPYENTAPVPDGSISPDFKVHAADVHVQDLHPQTTYHFRVVAHNAHGPVVSEERTFITQSAGGALVLADGRAWELVSPPDKLGARIEPISETGVVQAASGGGALTYLASTPTEPEPQGDSNEVQVLSTRGHGGWSSRDIAAPHDSATGKGHGISQEYRFFSEDLSAAVLQPFGEFVPELSAEASEQTAYLRSLDASCGSSCYRPLVTAANAPGVKFGEEGRCESGGGSFSQTVCGPTFLGATGDLSHVVLRSRAALRTGAGAEQLYEWAGGQLALISVLPGGEPAPEGPAKLGLEDREARRAISDDGSRIVWGWGSNVYMRDVPSEETIQLDLAEPGCLSCVSGGGQFQIASVDGSRVFFTDTQRLTKDAGEAGKPDLYECQIVEPAACSLTDLTPSSGESANVQGEVLGASEDGSRVYFVADGVLSKTPNATGESATPGRPNLYVRRAGKTAFIAALSAEDSHDWTDFRKMPVRVAPHGEWLEFMSQLSLTGYDNRDVSSGQPAAEVYVYGAGTTRVVCASCDPTGARPIGVEYKKLEPGSGGLVGGPRDVWPSTALVAANVPGWIMIKIEGEARYQPRYLSDSGRLFFNTADRLVPQDANGTQDVYQYEPPGVGGCTSSSVTFGERSGGCVGLVSSGGSAQESAFLDASETGGDVFFLTAAKLTPQDVDAALDVYDAHECTSDSPCIPISPAQSPPCTTEASCKASPTSQPSIFGAPSSATFSGAGNLASSLSPPVKHKTTGQLRAERLTKALKACRAKKNKHKRRACEKQARKKYGAKAKAKAKPKNTRAKKSRHATNRRGK